LACDQAMIEGDCKVKGKVTTSADGHWQLIGGARSGVRRATRRRRACGRHRF
jgi:hypothetical protein